MTTMSSDDRAHLAEALSTWAEALEAPGRASVARLNLQGVLSADTVEGFTRQILVELTTVVAAIVITHVESGSDGIGADLQAQGLAPRVLEQLAAKEDVLARQVIERYASVDTFMKRLTNDAQFMATAGKFGATTPTERAELARPIAVETAQKLQRVIRDAVPALLDAAREPSAVALLEAQLRIGLGPRVRPSAQPPASVPGTRAGTGCLVLIVAAAAAVATASAAVSSRRAELPNNEMHLSSGPADGSAPARR